MAYLLSGMVRPRVLAVAFLLCAICLGWGAQAQTMLPAAPEAPSTPFLPYLDYLLDETGTLDVEEAAAPDKAGAYRSLTLGDLPRENGVMWLRFTLAPLPEDARPATLLLDMGESAPGTPLLYEPVVNSLSGALEWRESAPAQRNVLLLPEAGKEPQTCYIRLDGLPGLWFAPMMRTPQNAAGNWGGLSRTAAALALGVVMLLCLLRGLSEKGQWRVWTALYVAVALAQGIMGMPASGAGHIGLGALGAVLAPGVALMLLPHVGRHLMRTRERSRALDIQLLLLSLPGAALALLPLLPHFAWLIRYLDLWPLGTLFFVPTALGAWIMGLGGAKRFLLGCLLPPLFVAGGMLGLDSGFGANLLASTPLWGTALSALIIAATRAPHDMTAQQPDAATAARNAQAESDDAIPLDQPLDDPNLRLTPSVLPASAPPPNDSEATEASAPSALPENFAPQPLESALRIPLDRLMREGAALGHCSLPSAVRQYAENMLDAAREMADIISNPRQLKQKRAAPERRAPFNLQHLMREAHDSVAPAAENAGIGLAWYMPPHLGHLYEGEGAALKETLCLLLESAVRATRHGAVHFSVRRVPESSNAGHLLFTVTDTGSGMPPQDRSSLALTRVWELAGAHKGFLGVECSPHGATIAFTLHLKSLERGENESAPAQQNQPLALLAAESASEREALARMLENLPCGCVQAGSLAEALQLHKKNAALLLVAQGRLASPEEGGILRQFRTVADDAGLPLFKALAITKNDTQWDRLAEAGFTHALLEPVDGEALCQTVRELLEAAAAEDTPDKTQATATTSGADAADDDQAATNAGRPPLPDLFGSEEHHSASPLKIPDLTALPDLLSFAESLRGPLVGTGADRQIHKAENALPGSQPESGPPLNNVDLPPADAGLPPVSRLETSKPEASKDAEAGPEHISVGLFGHFSDSDNPNLTAAPEPVATAQERQPEKSGESHAASESADMAAPEPDSIESAPEPAAETDDFMTGAAPAVQSSLPGTMEQAPPVADQTPEPEYAPTQAMSSETPGNPMRAEADAHRQPAFEPVTFAARPGATIVPIQRKAAVKPVVPAGVSPVYTSPSLNVPGEWVGEPMPIGSPLSSRPQERDNKAAPRAEDPAPRNSPQEGSGSVHASPGLNVPDEWVGEPVPIPKKPAPAAPVTEDRQMPAVDQPAPPDAPVAAQSTDHASVTGGSIMDFIASAEPVRKDIPSLAPLIAEVSGPARPVAPAPTPMPLTTPAQEFRVSDAAAPPLVTAPQPSQAAPDKTILHLVDRLDAAMEEARQAFESRRASLVGEAAERIAAESDAFGFRVLSRMARCVERAAKANDMNALKDLLPELAVAVERNRIALTPRK